MAVAMMTIGPMRHRPVARMVEVRQSSSTTESLMIRHRWLRSSYADDPTPTETACGNFRDVRGQT
jgi:hypothetical protein